MRITRGVFFDLAIWMVGFGLCIGVGFPFFVGALGVPSPIAMKPVFFAACLGAGALAGIINYSLARWIVGARLKLLASGMNEVEGNLSSMTFSGDLTGCTPDTCSIAVDSQDEIGESAMAFNRLVESLSMSMRTQAAVQSFTAMLTSQVEIDSLGEHALSEFFAHTGAVGGLMLYESDGELRIAASSGLRDPESVAASDHVMVAMLSGQRQVVFIPEDVRIEGVVADFRPSEIIVDPITYKNTPLGAVVLATGASFDAGQRALIDSFMQGLGLAVNNALAHERLQRLVVLDPLTGIYNRRFGLSRLREEFARAVRSGTQLGLIMFDIDQFKAINDTYGHLIGDRILRSISAIARGSLREGDVLFRYGGEEFIAVLPAASGQDLRIVGERLRAAIASSVVQDGDKPVHVTVSVGAGSYPDHRVESEDELIRLADEALYRAKDAGRNRVEVSASDA